MKNLTIKFAIYYLLIFDKSKFLYFSLSKLNTFLRWIFYFAITFTLWQTVELATNFINLDKYSLSSLLTNIITVIGTIFKVMLIFFMFGLTSYESLFSNNVNVDDYISEHNLKLQKIKDGKLESWRLRNRSLFSRILIYLTFWALLFHILQFLMINLFFQYENLTKEIYIAFLMDLITATIYLTVIYIISVSILDYFVRKNRSLK